MIINGTHIEDSCKSLLQKDISFEIRNKTIKKGKIVLFFQRNFHIVFILDTDKTKRDKIEIPIPFKIEHHEEDNLVYFDYRVSTFSKMYPECEPYLTLYKPKVAKSKFYDTILVLSGVKNERIK